MILKSFNSFREIKVPNSSDIVSSIKAKNESLKFQKDKSKQYLNKNESNNDFKLTNENHIKKITKVKTFKERYETIKLIPKNGKNENKKKKEIIISELKISSDSHLNFIKESLAKKLFWKQYQLTIIMNTHKRFLEEEFFSIISEICSEMIYDIVYEDNFDILETQINEDKDIIIEIFEPYQQKIDTKNDLKEEKLEDNLNKGTNYLMKETENIREIKVSVQINLLMPMLKLQ